MIINIAGYEVVIDDEDFEKISSFQWHKRSVYKYIYFCRGQGLRKILLHRFIMNAPKDKIVDHINTNTLDNRKCNLRLCTRTENSRNRKTNNTNVSGYKGVSKHRGKWQAQIEIDKKPLYLGLFSTPEEAHKAYCEASKKYHKEFGRVV